MVRHVRLVHKIPADRFHVHTSPDVRELHASSETKAGVQREAIAVLDLIATHHGVERPLVEFIDVPALQAAE